MTDTICRCFILSVLVFYGVVLVALHLAYAVAQNPCHLPARVKTNQMSRLDNLQIVTDAQGITA